MLKHSLCSRIVLTLSFASLVLAQSPQALASSLAPGTAEAKVTRAGPRAVSRRQALRALFATSAVVVLGGAGEALGRDQFVSEMVRTSRESQARNEARNAHSVELDVEALERAGYSDVAIGELGQISEAVGGFSEKQIQEFQDASRSEERASAHGDEIADLGEFDLDPETRIPYEYIPAGGQSRVRVVVHKEYVPGQTGQYLEVFKDGQFQWSAWVSTGMAGHTTPDMNNRTPILTDKIHTSSIYGSRMDNFVKLTDGGIGTHQTPFLGQLGMPASHGCIRMTGEDSERLYNLVRSVGMGNVSYVVGSFASGNMPNGVAPYIASSRGAGRMPAQKQPGQPSGFSRFFQRLFGRKPEPIPAPPASQTLPIPRKSTGRTTRT